MQQLKPLWRQLGAQNRCACDIAARPAEARYDAELDRINAEEEDDRNCRGRRLGSECRRRRSGHDDSQLTANQIGRQSRQPVVLALCPTVFDGDILALDMAGFVEAPSEWRQADSAVGFRGSDAEPADHRHRLLRTRRKRPCYYRAADEGDDLAAQHAQDAAAAPAAIL